MKMPTNTHTHTHTHTHTYTHLNNLKLGYVHHDGRDLAAVVALEGLGHRRTERAAGAVVHLLGSVRFDLVRFDLVRFDLVRFGSIWFGSVWCVGRDKTILVQANAL